MSFRVVVLVVGRHSFKKLYARFQLTRYSSDIRGKGRRLGWICKKREQNAINAVVTIWEKEKAPVKHHRPLSG